MRGGILLLLMLLVACGRTATDIASLQPGVDVAQAALHGGSPQTALQIIGRVLQTAPSNEAALVVQGDALTELGRFDEARISYTNALNVNSRSVGAEIGLGRLDLSSDPARAEGRFLDALNHDPRNVTALNDLGVARDLQGNHAGAQSAYRQALGINPQDTSAEVNLALSIAMSGSAQDAVQMLRPLASAPGATRKVRHDLAAALTMAGDRDEAARILSADLSPEQVQQALNAYATARSGGAAALVSASPASEPAIAPRIRPRPGTAAALPPASPASEPAVASPVAATHVSGIQVQFAAVPTQDAAQETWRRLQGQIPTLLSGRQPAFVRVEHDGQVFWRVRTNGFSNEAEASAFCHQAETAGVACTLGGL
jgi:Flp pilus assembly protein TadD